MIKESGVDCDRSKFILKGGHAHIFLIHLSSTIRWLIYKQECAMRYCLLQRDFILRTFVWENDRPCSSGVKIVGISIISNITAYFRHNIIVLLNDLRDILQGDRRFLF